MTCPDCDAARVAPDYRLYNPLCIYCGARLLKAIRAKQIDKASKIDRMRKVLADWVAYGHDEKQLRKMEAEDCKPIAPIETKEKAK